MHGLGRDPVVVGGIAPLAMSRRRSSLKASYAYMWEYLVVPDHVIIFEQAYGPSGEWVQLFRRAPGYVRTELLHDRSNSNRFITVDHWESESAWKAFRSRFSKEFEALDARCEELTTLERELGRFQPVE